MPEKNDYTAPIRIVSADGVCVLTASFTLPLDLTPRCAKFYGNIIKSLRKAVCEDLSAESKLAYDACTDRRKRYRYTPCKVTVCVSPCDDYIGFKLTKNDRVLICERHIWRDDLLVKRVTKI